MARTVVKPGDIVFVAGMHAKIVATYGDALPGHKPTGIKGRLSVVAIAGGSHTPRPALIRNVTQHWKKTT